MDSTNTAKFIQGYWRGQKDEPGSKKEDGGVILAIGMLASVVLLFAVIYIQTTLVCGGAVGVGIVIKQFFANRAVYTEKPKLIVNDYDGKTKELVYEV